MWNLPRPRIKPVCPAWAGGFLTTGPREVPHIFLFHGGMELSIVWESQTMWLPECDWVRAGLQFLALNLHCSDLLLCPHHQQCFCLPSYIIHLFDKLHEKEQQRQKATKKQQHLLLHLCQTLEAHALSRHMLCSAQELTHTNQWS